MKQNLIRLYIIDNKLNIEKIMNDFTPYIYKIIKNRSSNLSDEDIEEIISDVFLAIWKNQNKLDASKEMSAYISGITKNILNKKIRNLKESYNIEDYLNYIENMDIKIEQNEKSNLIIDEINNMKSEDKTIFMSYYYYSKSMKEIANKLNISEQKVKSRLFRIRKKLKRSFEKRGYSYNG